MCSSLLVLMFFAGSVAGQQQTQQYDVYDLNNQGKLEIVNRTVSSITDSGRRGIRFSDLGEDGIAWIEGADFSNGTIELDIRGSAAFQRSFVGVAFHGVDNDTLDAIYFRPFNFLSTDSVRRIHAVQYVAHPQYDWKRLREEQNGKYERSIGQALNPDEWFHVKIEVTSPHIKVFVEGSEEPCLVVEKLNNRKSGKIGLWVGFNSGGEFANLSITDQTQP